MSNKFWRELIDYTESASHEAVFEFEILVSVSGG